MENSTLNSLNSTVNGVNSLTNLVGNEKECVCRCELKNKVSHENVELGVFCSCRRTWKNEVRSIKKCNVLIL